MTIESSQYFEWLTELRDSGRINMMGASIELQDEFDLNRADARRIFNDWCKSLTNKGDK